MAENQNPTPTRPTGSASWIPDPRGAREVRVTGSPPANLPVRNRLSLPRASVNTPAPFLDITASIPDTASLLARGLRATTVLEMTSAAIANGGLSPRNGELAARLRDAAYRELKLINPLIDQHLALSSPRPTVTPTAQQLPVQTNEDQLSMRSFGRVQAELHRPSLLPQAPEHPNAIRIEASRIAGVAGLLPAPQPPFVFVERPATGTLLPNAVLQQTHEIIFTPGNVKETLERGHLIVRGQPLIVDGQQVLISDTFRIQADKYLRTADTLNRPGSGAAHQAALQQMAQQAITDIEVHRRLVANARTGKPIPPIGPSVAELRHTISAATPPHPTHPASVVNPIVGQPNNAPANHAPTPGRSPLANLKPPTQVAAPPVPPSLELPLGVPLPEPAVAPIQIIRERDIAERSAAHSLRAGETGNAQAAQEAAAKLSQALEDTLAGREVRPKSPAHVDLSNIPTLPESHTIQAGTTGGTTEPTARVPAPSQPGAVRVPAPSNPTTPRGQSLPSLQEVETRLRSFLPPEFAGPPRPAPLNNIFAIEQARVASVAGLLPAPTPPAETTERWPTGPERTQIQIARALERARQEATRNPESETAKTRLAAWERSAKGEIVATDIPELSPLEQAQIRANTALSQYREAVKNAGAASDDVNVPQKGLARRDRLIRIAHRDRLWEEYHRAQATLVDLQSEEAEALKPQTAAAPVDPARAARAARVEQIRGSDNPFEAARKWISEAKNAEIATRGTHGAERETALDNLRSAEHTLKKLTAAAKVPPLPPAPPQPPSVLKTTTTAVVDAIKADGVAGNVNKLGIAATATAGLYGVGQAYQGNHEGAAKTFDALSGSIYGSATAAAVVSQVVQTAKTAGGMITNMRRQAGNTIIAGGTTFGANTQIPGIMLGSMLLGGFVAGANANDMLSELRGKRRESAYAPIGTEGVDPKTGQPLSVPKPSLWLDGPLSKAFDAAMKKAEAEQNPLSEKQQKHVRETLIGNALHNVEELKDRKTKIWDSMYRHGPNDPKKSKRELWIMDTAYNIVNDAFKDMQQQAAAAAPSLWLDGPLSKAFDAAMKKAEAEQNPLSEKQQKHVRETLIGNELRDVETLNKRALELGALYNNNSEPKKSDRELRLIKTAYDIIRSVHNAMLGQAAAAEHSSKDQRALIIDTTLHELEGKKLMEPFSEGSSLAAALDAQFPKPAEAARRREAVVTLIRQVAGTTNDLNTIIAKLTDYSYTLKRNAASSPPTKPSDIEVLDGALKVVSIAKSVEDAKKYAAETVVAKPEEPKPVSTATPLLYTTVAGDDLTSIADKRLAEMSKQRRIIEAALKEALGGKKPSNGAITRALATALATENQLGDVDKVDINVKLSAVSEQTAREVATHLFKCGILNTKGNIPPNFKPRQIDKIAECGR